MRQHDTLFIGGDWVAPAGTGTIDVISPHTEEIVGRVPDGTPADMDRAVAAARQAFDHGPWPRMTMAERAAVVARLAEIYAEPPGGDGRAHHAEMGSPISFSQMAQAPQPLGMLQYYAELGTTFAVEEERPGMFGPVTVRREPVGVVAAVVPWNVPQFVIMTKLAPALVAGCTIVIKPAPETPLDSYLLAEMIDEAGIPAGVVNIVAAGREAGEHLVSPPRRRQGRLHRLHRRRPPHRRHLRRAAQAVHPGARRQVGRDHPGRLPTCPPRWASCRSPR